MAEETIIKVKVDFYLRPEDIAKCAAAYYRLHQEPHIMRIEHVRLATDWVLKCHGTSAEYQPVNELDRLEHARLYDAALKTIHSHLNKKKHA